MDKKHRERGENWTAEEKAIFIDIIKDSVRIIECKNTDTNTNKRKQAEWQKVQKKFQELTGKLRDVAQLKGIWRRMRLVAKKNVFQHRRALRAAGGGEKPPSPSQEEKKIVEMCRTDFITKENEFDSDGILHKDEIIQNETKEDGAIANLACAAGTSKPGQNAGQPQQEDNRLIFDIKEETSFYEEMIIENLHPEVTTQTDRLSSTLGIEIKGDVQHEIINNENTRTLHRPQKIITDRAGKRSKPEYSHKATLVETNIDLKEKTFRLLEEEYALKLHYQRQELCHQEKRHKLELDILLLEKEKKELELSLLKHKQFL